MRNLLFLSLLVLSSSLMAQDAPLREIAVIFTDEGYYPKSISVFEGEKVRFFVTSTTEKPQCFIVESHKLFLSANKGKITEGEVLFDRPGKFSFYCPSSKNDGRVVVLEKKKKSERSIASEKKDPLKWVPKDYQEEAGIYE
ncbi:MAG: cupredoxin domain-containing protein [Bacteriovoracaceae bacterium]